MFDKYTAIKFHYPEYERSYNHNEIRHIIRGKHYIEDATGIRRVPVTTPASIDVSFAYGNNIVFYLPEWFTWYDFIAEACKFVIVVELTIFKKRATLIIKQLHDGRRWKYTFEEGNFEGVYYSDSEYIYVDRVKINRGQCISFAFSNTHDRVYEGMRYYYVDYSGHPDRALHIEYPRGITPKLLKTLLNVHTITRDEYCDIAIITVTDECSEDCVLLNLQQ